MEKSARVIGVMVLVAGVVGIGAYAAQARLLPNRLALVTQLAPNPLAAAQLAPNLFEVNTRVVLRHRRRR